MAKQIKDSSRMILGSARDTGAEGKMIFFVQHKNITGGDTIPVGEDAIKPFLVKMAKLKEYCKKHDVKFNFKTYDQVMDL